MNKYRPVNRSKASGASATKPIQVPYLRIITARVLKMTATVKAMDSQRWVCRTHLFQFNGTSSEDDLGMVARAEAGLGFHRVTFTARSRGRLTQMPLCGLTSSPILVTVLRSTWIHAC